jgi:predicted CXXCH cytochrome family protein
MRIGSKAMKKLFFIGLGSALMVTMGGVGSASANGGPHSIPMAQAGSTGNMIASLGAEQCANCHRAHTAKTDKLTLQAQPAICLNCHGGPGLGSVLDVTDGVLPGTGGGALRGGGFTNALIGTATAQKDMLAADSVTGRIGTTNRIIPALTVGKPVTSTHQIDGTTSGTMWGNGTNGIGQSAVTLECGSCHDPHGNGNFRILKPAPTGSTYVVTAAVPAGPGGVPAAIPAVMSGPTPNVNIPDQIGKNYTVVTARSAALAALGPKTAVAVNGNYWDVQADGTPLINATTGLNTTVGAGTTVATDGFLGNISAWCTTCHTRYLSAGASTITGDPTYSYKHRSDEGLSDKPNCIQCHVSHGSNAAMSGAAAAVTNPDGSSGIYNQLWDPKTGLRSQPVTDSRLLRVDNRGVCLECHNM